jgi:hypothetical protein
MELIVVDHQVTIRAASLPDQVRTFDDVPACLAWVEEQLLDRPVNVDITIHDVIQLYPKEQRPALQMVYGKTERSARFQVTQYNEPLADRARGFWWFSLTEAQRTRLVRAAAVATAIKRQKGLSFPKGNRSRRRR